MSKKRTRIEIINDILSVIITKQKIKPTHLMYKSNLSHMLMKSYLEELIDKNFVQEIKKDIKGFKDDKGITVLEL